MQPFDLKICIKVISGDSNAFEQFFRHWYPMVYAFCADYVKDDALAKDIVQDSFVELWKRRDRISKPSSLVSYLFTIVRNRSYKEVSSRHTLFSLSNQDKNIALESEINSLMESITSLDMICLKEIKRDLATIVSNLPDQSRKVLSMKLNGNMTCKEIAETMGLSVRTVENEYFRAIQSIRKKMKELSNK